MEQNLKLIIKVLPFISLMASCNVLETGCFNISPLLTSDSNISGKKSF